MRLSELKHKEVINEKDCKRLGRVCDIEFDEKTGCVRAFIVQELGRICCIFGRDTEYVIPFKCVCQIGDDIILVCVDEKSIEKKEQSKDKFKDNFLGF